MDWYACANIMAFLTGLGLAVYKDIRVAFWPTLDELKNELANGVKPELVHKYSSQPRETWIRKCVEANTVLPREA